MAIIGLCAVGSSAVLLAAGHWFSDRYPAIKAHREEMRRMEPMIKEAESLALDYEKVLSGKDTYIGKYVLWCVQNISEDEVFYRGDMAARLSVSNYERMPLFPGDKHMGCAEMLLNIEDVRRPPSGAGVVLVEFVYSRQESRISYSELPKKGE